jgi:hypothetical protein
MASVSEERVVSYFIYIKSYVLAFVTEGRGQAVSRKL